jgi:hypothetical protein
MTGLKPDRVRQGRCRDQRATNKTHVVLLADRTEVKIVPAHAGGRP